MIWYEDEQIRIAFNKSPSCVIHERHILPSMSKDEKNDIIKYPIISSSDLECYITDIRSSEIKQYVFKIDKGTKSDGATIPRFVWSILGITPTDPRVIEAAFVHDELCKKHELINNDRYLATKVFERMIYVGGVDEFRRWAMFHSVDNFQKFCGW